MSVCLYIRCLLGRKSQGLCPQATHVAGRCQSTFARSHHRADCRRCRRLINGLGNCLPVSPRPVTHLLAADVYAAADHPAPRESNRQVIGACHWRRRDRQSSSSVAWCPHFWLRIVWNRRGIGSWLPERPIITRSRPRAVARKRTKWSITEISENCCRLAVIVRRNGVRCSLTSGHHHHHHHHHPWIFSAPITWRT